VTRDDAKTIMENLAVISHYSAGGEVEYPFFRCDGEFIRWGNSRSLNLCCLGRYRIVGDPMKAHVKHNPQQLIGAEPRESKK
jgi:hypothetical protein